MTQPDCFNTTICPGAYQRDAAVTDAANVITSIRTLLVTTLGWSEPSTGLFKTPLNAGSQWMDVLITKITATKLEMRVRDHMGHTICTRRITADATTDYAYYVSKFSFVLESLRATSEILQAWMIEQTPNNDGDFPWVVYANGYLTTGDANDGQADSIVEHFHWEDAGATYRATQMLNASTDGVGVISRTTGSGAFLAEDVAMGIVNAAFGTPPRFLGRFWHAYLIDSTIAFQTDKTLMVSDAASETFRVIGLATINTTRLALRKTFTS